MIYQLKMVIYPLKMVIFHSYVSLPEGMNWWIATRTGEGLRVFSPKDTL